MRYYGLEFNARQKLTTLIEADLSSKGIFPCCQKTQNNKTKVR